MGSDDCTNCLAASLALPNAGQGSSGLNTRVLALCFSMVRTKYCILPLYYHLLFLSVSTGKMASMNRYLVSARGIGKVNS